MIVFSSGPASSPELMHVRRLAIGVRCGGSRSEAIFDIMQFVEVRYEVAHALLDDQLRYLDRAQVKFNEQGVQAE